MSKQGNDNLRVFYENAYEAGEKVSFTFFENGKSMSQDSKCVLAATDWGNKRVLDVGCGTGTLVRSIAELGAANVLGLDYASAAIDVAKSFDAAAPSTVITYVCANFGEHDFNEKFDVICSLGTLEHLDDPYQCLEKMKGLLRPNGQIIIACPHFLNLRGYVWMALNKLLNVPMSLSDLHFIHPWDVAMWGEKLGMQTECIGTVDQDWSFGPKLLIDFKKRLNNAFRDAKIQTSGVGEYMVYLEKLVNHMASNNVKMDGATAIYRVSYK